MHNRGTEGQLTDSEIRALNCLASGMTAAAAARYLGISERTLRRRIRLICDRIGVDTPIEAVVWAAKNDVV